MLTNRRAASSSNNCRNVWETKTKGHASTCGLSHRPSNSILPLSRDQASITVFLRTRWHHFPCLPLLWRMAIYGRIHRWPLCDAPPDAIHPSTHPSTLSLSLCVIINNLHLLLPALLSLGQTLVLANCHGDVTVVDNEPMLQHESTCPPADRPWARE
jgi:hypothetical protein